MPLNPQLLADAVVASYIHEISPRHQRSALEPRKERTRQRLRMGERHHVAGALDQRVPRMRQAAPEYIADRAVDRRRARSLDDVNRHGRAGKRVRPEQLVVE